MTDAYLVDLAADQVPGLAPMVAALTLGSAGGCEVMVAHDTVVTYEFLPGDRSFTGTTDWRLEEVGPVSRMRDLLVASERWH